MDGGDGGASRELVGAWIAGWAAARGTPPPVPDDDGFRVDVGWPGQRVRYVFPACSERFRRLGETIAEPWVFLKVCAPPEVVRAALPPRWRIERVGYLMTASSAASSSSPILAAGYATEVEDRLPVATARILAANGDVAASGNLALAADHAIYDRIETHEAHRRRGLGSVVMDRLGRVARDRGTTRGVLVATAEGRALYETLGFRLHALYTTAVVPAA